MRVGGAILGLVGVVLGLRSVLLLAGKGRPKRGPSPAFVIAGPYVRMRNPLFAGVVLALSGAALVGESPALGVIAATTALGLHLWVVWREEPRLRRRFGEVYDAYLRYVPRWLPRRSRVHPPGDAA